MKFKNQFIKDYKPTTPSLRHRKILTQPKKNIRIKSSSASIKNHAGRNNTGSITTRHHGGRHKRYHRDIDFKRLNAPYALSSLLSIENDPNRSANIARYFSPLFKSFYIVAPENISNEIQGPKYPYNRYVKNGDTLPLSDIPIGSKCYNIQTNFNSNPTIARSSGSAATLLKTDSINATIRLPSKKIINLNKRFLATVGQPSNSNKNLTVKGKAGANRWRGKRPTVRGYAMNAHDHPHGGKTSGGIQPKTLWGKQAKWVKTRKTSS